MFQMVETGYSKSERSINDNNNNCSNNAIKVKSGIND